MSRGSLPSRQSKVAESSTEENGTARAEGDVV
jgi:hypothetical protein